jgi:hypothetical protein
VAAVAAAAITMALAVFVPATMHPPGDAAVRAAKPVARVAGGWGEARPLDAAGVPETPCTVSSQAS